MLAYICSALPHPENEQAAAATAVTRQMTDVFHDDCHSLFTSPSRNKGSTVEVCCVEQLTLCQVVFSVMCLTEAQ